MRADDLQFVIEGSPFFRATDIVEGEPPLVDLGGDGGPLGRGWRVVDHGWWTIADPGLPLPAAGWKIHVSPDPEHLADELGRAVAVLVQHGVAFKVLSSRRAEFRSRSKFAPRLQVGKVLVAYPGDVATTVAVAGALDDVLRRPGGPVVVGEHRLGHGPVHLRHGAFEQLWLTAGGSVAPGVRSAEGIEADVRGSASALPAEIAALLEARARPREQLRLPLTAAVVLHRTGGGAVYSGRWEGRDVVVKEARRRAGLDSGGVLAEDRLRHEARVLQRLAGSSAAPEFLALMEGDDHVFLIMERVAGSSLHRLMAHRHPTVFATEESIEADAAEYRRWSATVLRGLRVCIDEVHARGVLHGDVSPQNVMVEGEEVRLIDFESAVLDGEQVSCGVFTPGFGAALASVDGDTASVEAIERMFANPLVPALALHRPVAGVDTDALLTAGRGDLAPGFRTNPGEELVDDGELRARLLAGIRSATRVRDVDEHLVPGGIASFAHPAAGLGVSHGAAGVVATLLAIGEQLDSEVLDALERRALAAPPIPGAGEGLHGVARVLAEAGRPEAALAVLGRLPVEPSGEPGWATGDTGRALALLAVHEVTGEERLLRAVEAHLRAVVAAAGVSGSEAGTRGPGPTGLGHGPAGVAWALAAAARRLPASVSLDRDELLRAARAVLDREPRHVVPGSGFVLSPTPRGFLPSLGEGIAASALAARAIAGGTGPVEVPPEAIAGVIEALRVPACALAGLFAGRAGLLAGLSAWLPDDDPSVLLHRRRLAWQAVHATGHGDALFMLADGNLRPSCDVSTGSSGVLAALAGADAVAAVLGFTALARVRPVPVG